MKKSLFKLTKANNYGKGFYYECADGHRGWVLGLSAAEKRNMVREHGQFVDWVPMSEEFERSMHW